MPKALTQNNSLIGAITDQPLLVSPSSESYFSTLLTELSQDEDFMGCWALSGPNAARETDDEFWDEESGVTHYRPYNVENGVLMIPVQGVLLNKFSFQFGRHATGYQYIERAFNRGMADPDVRSIALVIDSPGGVVAGNFELVESMAVRRGEKPVRAFAAEHAYSAAYSIASAADQIVIERSGGVGSVGVVVMHVEVSEALKGVGIKVNFIFAGKHKVDGNPYEKLPEAARERIQGRVDRIYGEFVALVAENRGMAEQAVRDTEALTYDASEALDVGFADRVGALDTEMAAFMEEAEPEDDLMAGKTTETTPAAGDQGGITQAQLDQAVADAKAEGQKEGATAERKRRDDIMGCDAAKTRPRAAATFVAKGIDAETAMGLLEDLPEEQAQTPASEEAEPKGKQANAGPTPFDQTMSKSGNPEVGAEAAAEDDDTPGPEATSNTLLNSYAAQTGRKRQAAN